MVFPFTFTSILPYPFSSSADSSTRSEPEQPQSPWLNILAESSSSSPTPATTSRTRLPRPPRRVITDSGEASTPLPRKRGWEPLSSPSAAEATTTNRSVAGYFDPHARYQEGGKRVGGRGSYGSVVVDRVVNSAAPPAPKRRRLGESIIETALNAALVGTAVGLAAFRLWRDRGKASESEVDAPPVPAKNDPPPPPYEPRPAYVEVPEPQHSSPTPATPGAARPGIYRKPTRPIRASPRTKPSVRKLPTTRASTSTLRSSALERELSHKKSNMTMAAPESYDNGEDGVDDQMDWMSERLRGLIEQGQQALRKEVVVMDDSVVDEHQGVEDDGSDDWEDDERITPTALKRSRSNASLPVLSRSVSQRDLHAPIQSPYKLPALPAPRLKSTQAPPPSAWSAGRTRTTPTAIPPPPPQPISRTTTAPVPAPMPRSFATRSPSRQPSTQSLSRHFPVSHTGTLNGDDVVSASPEMKGFMERALARVDR